MLLSKNIKITLNRGNLGFYNKLMCAKFKLEQEIIVPIEILPKGYKGYVTVACDICKNINEVKYKNYNECLGYGFYSCIKCKHIKKKMTSFEKYGDENFNNSKKREETMNLEYGFYNNNREKSKETCFEKYGINNISQLDSVKSKKINTTILNYGVENPTYIQDNKFIYNQNGYVSYDKDNKLHNIKCGEHIFKISTNLFYSRYYRKSKICTICNNIEDTKSQSEKELFEFIESHYDGEIQQSYRDGLEIDIYIPELKIGFEFNGLYWHSTQFKEKNYHLNKTNYFKDRGIKIIHIWEDDWNLKKNIIKSIILNKINKSNRIFARKTYIKEITDRKSIKHFLSENHLQGFSNNIKICIGLYQNDELVSIMAFDNLEGRNRMVGGFNISRFCNKLNTSIIGGASKILNFFIKKYKPNYIISYADYALSDGLLYQSLGFSIIGNSYPDYTYVINGNRKHKSNYKKEKLGIKGKSISENEFMKKMDIYRIYDCGKIKFKMMLTDFQ